MAHALHFPRTMNTKPSTSPFSSIDTALLTDVQGGCGRKRGCRRCCNKTVNITNNYAAPAPAPAAPAPSGGTSVDVSVGYAQQQ